MVGSRLESIIKDVSEYVEPDASEKNNIEKITETLIERAEDAIESLPVEGDVIQVGSTARGTWISGDRDIDIFICLPPSLSREKLEQYGLEVGQKVLPDGKQEYAEHPYIRGHIEGFAVDVVPCFAVEDATEGQSAVDRTPFHTEYLQDRLNDSLRTEIRITKQFLKGIGVYGSDLKTMGFSGYLTELLVLEYGGFVSLLNNVTEWDPPVYLDPDNHAQSTFEDPLIVIDPTDPTRNVAAVVSEENVAKLIHYARECLNQPRRDLFFPSEPDPLSKSMMRNNLNERDTTPLAIRFSTPDLVEDQLHPQLRRSLDGLTAGLDRHGFDVIRSAYFTNKSTVLFVEVSVDSLANIERHKGPPVSVQEHAKQFYEKYEGDNSVYGPFIIDGHYVVERNRTVTTPREFIEKNLFEIALGRNIRDQLQSNSYEVLFGEETTQLVEEFGTELAEYFQPKL
ncbi:MAG: CCA tRNA nucleotidyltransferase [Halobacteriaceae archaeon]